MKRFVDVVGSALLLLFTGPLIAICALAIRATSRGPALFRQTRVGYSEEPFELLKLRTMYVNNDDSAHRAYAKHLISAEQGTELAVGGVYKLQRDPRVTPLGRVLRRMSIDELPQLVNVLRGDMSLVGPRPALPWEVELYGSAHRRRAEVRPGLTGLWQVSGRSRLTTNQMLELDVEYVDRRTLPLDLWILARTPVVLLRGDGTA